MKNLTTSSIRELFPKAKVRSYAKGQIICYMGDKPQYIFFVSRGHVKYYDIDEQGNEKILHLIGPHNIFPMLYAFGVSEDVGAFYSTLEAVEIVTVPLQEFRRATETNIEFANVLTRWFLSEISQLVYRISSLEKTGSRVKILHALKFFAVHYGQQQGAWQKLSIPVTHQFIADFTGLARETVSATMHDLTAEKVIKPGSAHKLEIKRSQLNKIS